MHSGGVRAGPTLAKGSGGGQGGRWQEVAEGGGVAGGGRGQWGAGGRRWPGGRQEVARHGAEMAQSMNTARHGRKHSTAAEPSSGHAEHSLRNCF